MSAVPRSVMAAVNDEIDRLHRHFNLIDSDFFCECGDSGCKELITLPRGAFQGLRDALRPICHPAHADRMVSSDLSSPNDQTQVA